MSILTRAIKSCYTSARNKSEKHRMGKLKTKKSISKRFRITRNKKLIHRTAGQDHFNARESGKTTRSKRADRSFSESHKKTLITAVH